MYPVSGRSAYWSQSEKLHNILVQRLRHHFHNPYQKFRSLTEVREPVQPTGKPILSLKSKDNA